MILTRRALLTSSAALALCPTAHAGRYALRRPEAAAPLTALVTWAPKRPGDLVIALHGHQSADAEPTWFAWLRTQPSFAGKALLVPAIGDPAAWASPGALAAITAQLDALAPTRTFLIGFSSGATFGFQVAAALADRLSGFAPIAGPMPHGVDAAKLAGVPVLMACMELDTGVPCGALDEGAATLAAAGVAVERHTFKGVGHECPLDVVAPALSTWMDRVGR